MKSVASFDSKTQDKIDKLKKKLPKKKKPKDPVKTKKISHMNLVGSFLGKVFKTNLFANKRNFKTKLQTYCKENSIGKKRMEELTLALTNKKHCKREFFPDTDKETRHPHIKFIITDFLGAQIGVEMLKKLSKLGGTQIQKHSTHGLVHVAVTMQGVGYLEWNRFGLVVPKQPDKDIVGIDALLAMDVDTFGKFNEDLTCEEMVNNVAEIIINWNLEKDYEPFTCNCQHFVIELLQSIGIEIRDSGVIGIFVNKLKHGICRREFEIRDEIFITNSEFEDHPIYSKFVKTDPETNEKVFVMEFNSHEELDNFVYHLQEKESWFKFDDVRSLLRGLDRGFWLKGASLIRADPKNRALPEFTNCKECSSGCPYKDPFKHSMNISFTA